MNLRKITLATLAVCALFLTSCGMGASKRLGKDVTIGVLSPGLVFYGGATDAYADSEDIAEGLGGGSITQFFTFPPLFLYHGLKHGIYGIIHILDIIGTPAYYLAEMHPYGPDVQPLDIYTGTWFDDEPADDSATDAETGERR